MRSPSKTQDLAADLTLAHRLADTARAISLAAFRGAFTRRTKTDGSIVTEIDEAVEDAVRAAVRAARPTDAFLGEERGEQGSGSRRWIVDAIDGTQSFADGADGWGTLIALEIDGRIAVGVCEMSPRDRRYWATRGGGAFRAIGKGAPERLHVSRTAQLADASVFIPDPQWLRTDAVRAKAAALLAAGRRRDSAEHPALEVAFGGCDVCVFFMAGPWDLAAPAIVVEEAGGRFSDVTGQQRLTNGALFSNGLLHDAALAAIR